MQHIISFSGNLGSGKDTIGAQVIDHLRFVHGKKTASFSFAKPLKEFCINVLGLNREHVYGSQKDKQQLTHLRWEDMPGIMVCDTEAVNFQTYNSFVSKLDGLGFIGTANLMCHARGPMTVRDVLQFFGTEVGRRVYDNIWIDALHRELENSDCEFAIITDGRFHNELDSLYNKNALLIKLLRQPIKEGLAHESEKQIETYTRWSAIIDNREMNEEEQRKIAIAIIENYFECLN